MATVPNPDLTAIYCRKSAKGDRHRAGGIAHVSQRLALAATEPYQSRATGGVLETLASVAKRLGIVVLESRDETTRAQCPRAQGVMVG